MVLMLLNSSTYEIEFIVGTKLFFSEYECKIKDCNVDFFCVPESVLATLGTLKTNDSVLAVCKIPLHKDILLYSNTSALVLDNIRDPGNMGTIIRIADWFGIDKILCSLTSVDLYNPKVIQASMGSFMNINIFFTTILEYLKDIQLPVIGTFNKGEDISTTHIPNPGIVIIGNESNGISKELLPYISKCVSIKKYGNAESLNAAIAAGIVCYRWKNCN